MPRARSNAGWIAAVAVAAVLLLALCMGAYYALLSGDVLIVALLCLYVPISLTAVAAISVPGSDGQHLQRSVWEWVLLFLLVVGLIPIWAGSIFAAFAFVPLVYALMIAIPVFGEWLDRNQNATPGTQSLAGKSASADKMLD